MAADGIRPFDERIRFGSRCSHVTAMIAAPDACDRAGRREWSCRGDPITARGPERFRKDTRRADLGTGHDTLRASGRGRPPGLRPKRPGAWWICSAWRPSWPIRSAQGSRWRVGIAEPSAGRRRGSSPLQPRTQGTARGAATGGSPKGPGTGRTRGITGVREVRIGSQPLSTPRPLSAPFDLNLALGSASAPWPPARSRSSRRAVSLGPWSMRVPVPPICAPGRFRDRVSGEKFSSLHKSREDVPGTNTNLRPPQRHAIIPLDPLTPSRTNFGGKIGHRTAG
jgi:hypothetical protein